MFLVGSPDYTASLNEYAGFIREEDAEQAFDELVAENPNCSWEILETEAIRVYLPPSCPSCGGTQDHIGIMGDMRWCTNIFHFPKPVPKV